LENIAALYLAHLNPITNAHEKIISQLAKDYHVYVFPVVFLKKGRETNTRTFPFPYELRKKMLLSLFDGHDNIEILPNYKFVSPFIKYLPPIISPYAWAVRSGILHEVLEDRFISYTGDKAERIALRFYNLHPIKAKRLEISSTNVRELLYREALENLRKDEHSNNTKDSFDHSNHNNYPNYHKDTNIQDTLKEESWHNMVPKTVAHIITENWKIVEKFAQSLDKTIKIFGMKFPTEGILN
jgi:nicotinic acid mononucleotide adenylyltransferase